MNTALRIGYDTSLIYRSVELGSAPLNREMRTDDTLPGGLGRKGPEVAQGLGLARHHLGKWRTGRARLPRPLRLSRALTNTRIVGLDDKTVSIKYQERTTRRTRTCRLSSRRPSGLC
jgi:hypothetical protein